MCDRPPISYQRSSTQETFGMRLPRQPAEATGPATPGSLGPLPFGAIPTLVREYLLLWQLGLILFGMPARGPSRPLHVWSVLGSPPFFHRLLSSSVGLPATTLSTEPHNSMKLVFTLERAFNRDTSVVCKPRSLGSEEFVEEDSGRKDPRHMSCNMYPVCEPQDCT